jgi:hypothetical protein
MPVEKEESTRADGEDWSLLSQEDKIIPYLPFIISGSHFDD